MAVKLNSADFQLGGFTADDAKKIVELLNGLGVDLVELSGGSYEAPAMQGEARDGRTLAREAYFVEFARDIQTVARMPVMVTGGIRRRPVAESVVQSGVDMVGIGTALPSIRTCLETGCRGKTMPRNCRRLPGKIKRSHPWQTWQ